MKILTVVGNRPQFIKAAAVSGPLREQHEEVLVHTGQHHDDSLSRVFFSELGLEPKQLGLSRHVVRPTSVIDWSTSVVGAAA